MLPEQSPPIRIGWRRKVKRAANYVKRFESWPDKDSIDRKRYERACAILLQDNMSK
jgi:hypothetical protein